MKMFKRRNLSYPIAALGAASFLLLMIVGFQTYMNYNHEKYLLKKHLLSEGVTLIRAIESGARTGMMEMRWGQSQVQTLIEETAKGPNISQILLVDGNGRILAAGTPKIIGETVTGFSKLKKDDQVVHGIVKNSTGVNVFQIVKKFEPVSSSRRLRMNEMRGRMMYRGRNNYLSMKKEYIILSFKLTEYRQAQSSDIHRALISAAILLILGSASFYFLIILQNYYVVNNTLKNMETYTRNVVEGMPNGLFSLDNEGRIETVNKYAADLLEMNHLNLKGKYLGEVLKKCDLSDIIAPTDENIVRQIDCTLNDGKVIPLSVTSSRLKNANGGVIGAVIILRDLREIKLLEKKIERSERLASLGRMAAGIAHEIRNPLSSIKGFALYFRNKFKRDSEDWNYAEVMAGEVDRLNRVIQDLLNFAKPFEPNLKKIDVHQLIEHSLKLIQSDARDKNIIIQKKFETDLPFILGDSDLLTQAMLNLFINAVDAMKQNGKLNIEVSLKEKMIEIVIADTGKGIESENLPHIFDPFFTLKKGGTGLGLAIVFRIIENHNGKIDVKSDIKKGTEFKIFLPKTNR